MFWQQLRAAVGWMPLVVGIMALLGGISELDLAARCTPEAQRVTLQELLDGKAGKNRYVEITDFQPCDHYVIRLDSRSKTPVIPYVGALPVHAEATIGSLEPPRVLIEPHLVPQCSLTVGSFSDWRQRQTISGILESPHTLAERDEKELRETYPGINLRSCRILNEGRKPSPAHEIRTYFTIGLLGLALGGWMLYPGLIPLVWRGLRGLKGVRPARSPSHPATPYIPPDRPAPQPPITPQAIRTGESKPTLKAPLSSRVVAVAYILSFAGQPLGFFVLAGIGILLWTRQGTDSRVLAFGLGSIGWVACCTVFRWWARRWGRR